MVPCFSSYICIMCLQKIVTGMLKWKNTGIAAKQDNSQESKTLPFTQNILYIYSQAVYVCVCVRSLIMSSCVYAYSMPPFFCTKKNPWRSLCFHFRWNITCCWKLYHPQDYKRFQMHLDNLKNAQRVGQVFLVVEREETRKRGKMSSSEEDGEPVAAHIISSLLNSD